MATINDMLEDEKLQKTKRIFNEGIPYALRQARKAIVEPVSNAMTRAQQYYGETPQRRTANVLEGRIGGENYPVDIARENLARRMQRDITRRGADNGPGYGSDMENLIGDMKGLPGSDLKGSSGRVPSTPGAFIGPEPNLTSVGAYGDTNVFKYTPVGDQRKEYGSAIFSDTPAGARSGGIDQAIKKYGRGISEPGRKPQRTDMYGNSLDLADRYNRTAEFMRQNRLARQPQPAQRQQPQGYAQPYTGQAPGIAQYQQALMRTLQNLPYGKPGDYRKRQSMLQQAEILANAMGQQQRGIADVMQNQLGYNQLGVRQQENAQNTALGQQRLAQEQANANRMYGLDLYKAMNPQEDYQYIAPTIDDYGKPIPERLLNKHKGTYKTPEPSSKAPEPSSAESQIPQRNEPGGGATIYGLLELMPADALREIAQKDSSLSADVEKILRDRGLIVE